MTRSKADRWAHRFQRMPNNGVIRKVAAHQPFTEVLKGNLEVAEYLGNSLADAAAGAAAGRANRVLAAEIVEQVESIGYLALMRLSWIEYKRCE